MGILLSLTFAFELIVFILAMHYLTRCFSIISIPGMAFIFLFFTHGYYIPLLLLRGEMYGPLVLDDVLKIRLFTTLSLMYIFLIAGIAATKYVFHFRVQEIVNYAKRPTVKRQAIYPAMILLFLAVLLFAGYFLHEIQVMQRFALYFSSFGQPDVIKQARAIAGEALNASGAIGYLWGFSLYVFFPFITLLFLSIFFSEKKLIFLIPSAILIVITGIALFSGLHRAQIVQFLVLVLLSFWVFKGKLIFQKREILPLFCFAIAAGALLYFFNYNIPLGQALYLVFHRFTEGTNLAWILHLKYFPDYYDFLWGRDIGLLSRIMGWDYVSSPQLIAETFGAKGGNFNALFISGLWVNFGYIGIVIGSFLLGVYLQWLQIWLVRLPKTPARLALYAYLIIDVWYLANVSIFPALFSFGLATTPLCLVALEIIGIITRAPVSYDQQGSKQKNENHTRDQLHSI